MILSKEQQQWIDDLRKYPERQIKGRLGGVNQDGEYKCCVLGQGIISKCEANGVEVPINKCGDFKFINNGLDMDLSILPITPFGSNRMVTMNDLGATFPEIADFMEKYKEKVFIAEISE